MRDLVRETEAVAVRDLLAVAVALAEAEEEREAEAGDTLAERDWDEEGLAVRDAYTQGDEGEGGGGRDERGRGSACWCRRGVCKGRQAFGAQWFLEIWGTASLG